MSFKNAVRIGLDEYLMGLRRILDGLTPEELRWQPSRTSNHIVWIVWHMARAEDKMIARAGFLNSIWVDGDWASKMGFGRGADDTGGGGSIDQVVAMPEVSVDLLLEYFTTVRERTISEFERSTDEDMANVYDHPPMGEITGAWVYGHAIVEESMHLGQIALIRGMQRGLEGADQRTRDFNKPAGDS